MKNVYLSAQGLPYELITKKIMFKNSINQKRLDEFVEIVKKYYPNYGKNDITKLFLSLKKHGCTFSSVANAIASQLDIDDNYFKKMFGYSLNIQGTNLTDYNKLLVDLYTFLYNIVKVKTFKYSTYSFESEEKAVEQLLGKKISDKNEAVLELFNNGYISSGIDENHNLLFKTKKPEIQEMIGTPSIIVKELFGEEINDITIEELYLLAKKHGCDIDIKFKRPADKLTDLTTTNANYWINYYLKSNNVNVEFNEEELDFRDYDYADFIRDINDLIYNGYTINVSSNRTNEVWMQNVKGKTWTKPYSDNAGHSMTLIGFNENNDIIVSSWGDNYVIPKDFFNHLEYKSIKIYEKEKSKRSI